MCLTTYPVADIDLSPTANAIFCNALSLTITKHYSIIYVFYCLCIEQYLVQHLESLAADRPSWRSISRTGVTSFEANRTQARETQRQLRHQRQQQAQDRPSSDLGTICHVRDVVHLSSACAVICAFTSNSSGEQERHRRYRRTSNTVRVLYAFVANKLNIVGC